MLKGLKKWFMRWQDNALFLPLMVIASILAYVFFGSEDPKGVSESIPLLSILPVKTAYAIAALGLTWFGRRRFRRRLSKDEQNAFWTAVMAGETGPLVVFFLDTVVYLCLAFLLFGFFALPA